jgi:parallel beta-helix repeat protein
MLMTVSTIIPVSATTLSERSSLTRENTLYVGGSGPNNYTKIQDAVNASSNGDTVYVFDDSAPYYETVVVNKSIRLIGEDMNTTIVQNLSKDKPVFTILADGTTFTGFFIKQRSTDNSGYPNALDVSSKNNIIQGNKIYAANGEGIVVTGGHNTVTFNIVIHAWEGIFVEGTDNNISYNHIEHTANGIYIYYSNDNMIFKNICIGNDANGIWMGNSKNNIIKYNTLSGNIMYAGLLAWLSYGNIIIGNTFSNNLNWGLQIRNGGNNTIIQNNFINNTINANFQRNAQYEGVIKIKFLLLKLIHPQEKVIYKMFVNNSWDKNYWDDLTTTPYVIPGRINFLQRLADHLERILNKTVVIEIITDNYDYHPAQEPYDIP